MSDLEYLQYRFREANIPEEEKIVIIQKLMAFLKLPPNKMDYIIENITNNNDFLEDFMRNPGPAIEQLLKTFKQPTRKIARESISRVSYLNQVDSNLRADGFGTQLDFQAFPQLIGSTVMSIGFWSLPVVLAVASVERVDIESIKDFNRQVRELGISFRRERNNLAISVLCSEHIPPAVIKWIQRVNIPKYKSYHSLPVVFDLSTQEAHYNRNRGPWGSQVYSRMKYVIGKHLDISSVEAKSLKKPRGLEIFLCIITIIMVVCLILMFIL